MMRQGAWLVVCWIQTAGYKNFSTRTKHQQTESFFYLLFVVLTNLFSYVRHFGLARLRPGFLFYPELQRLYNSNTTNKQSVIFLRQLLHMLFYGAARQILPSLYSNKQQSSLIITERFFINMTCRQRLQKGLKGVKTHNRRFLQVIND